MNTLEDATPLTGPQAADALMRSLKDPAPSLPDINLHPTDVKIVENRIFHFSKISKAGRYPGSSSGEKAANKLGKQVASLSDLMMSLDGDAKEGFLYALLYAAWPDARHIVLRGMPQP